MDVGWRKWKETVKGDDVERCKRILKGELGRLYDPYYALRILVEVNPPLIMSYLKEELKKVKDVRVRWYGLLMIACRALNKDVLDEILEEVDFKGNELVEPLYQVCEWGDEELVQLLISKGAPVDGYQEEPVRRVYQMDHSLDLSSKVLKELVIDPSKRVKERNPLIVASVEGYVEVVSILLSHGADVNLMSKSGETPLGIASYQGHIEVVEVLISHGADVNAVSDHGTPLSIATRRNCRDIVDLLISEGATLPPNDNIDHTAFIIDEIY